MINYNFSSYNVGDLVSVKVDKPKNANQKRHTSTASITWQRKGTKNLKKQRFCTSSCASAITNARTYKHLLVGAKGALIAWRAGTA